MFTNRENHQCKTPPGEFKVTTLENSLLSKQAVTSKWILVPYTNLQLNFYLNTQLDLFCSNNFSFSMHNSQYVTNQLMHGSKYVTNHQLENDIGCKVHQFINMMKITKLLGCKTIWHINTVTSSKERWTRAYVSDHNMHVTTSATTFASSFIHWDNPQKNPYICLGLWEKKA